ncbi:hypothetical protein BKA81DRAFT_358771 [Phyllosticta paracitricarpa]
MPYHIIACTTPQRPIRNRIPRSSASAQSRTLMRSLPSPQRAPASTTNHQKPHTFPLIPRIVCEQ